MARSGSEMAVEYRRLGYALLFLSLVLSAGTVSLVRMEHMTLGDALYMMVITLSTVGFGEVEPLGPAGRIIVSLTIMCGVALIGYVSVAIGGIVVEGRLRRYLGGRIMRKELDRLNGHYIICGFGRMGQIVSDELVSERMPHVVVTDDPEAVEELRAQDRLAVLGDATEDEVLEQAGVKRAKGLVATVSSDVANLYITLTARELSRDGNPDLYILARAAEDKAIRKLKHAGANRVVSPYHIGGTRLAMALLRPTVFDYLEVLSRSGDLELSIEELKVEPGCPLSDKRLRDTPIRSEYGLIVIGVLDRDGRMVFNPGPDQGLTPGDRLIVLGGKEKIGRLLQDTRVRA